MNNCKHLNTTLVSLDGAYYNECLNCGIQWPGDEEKPRVFKKSSQYPVWARTSTDRKRYKSGIITDYRYE